jgi:hypothetical protein
MTLASRRLRWALGIVVGALVLGTGLFIALGDPFWLRLLLEQPGAGRCESRLNRPLLTRSIELGTHFLLAHQKPEGNFDYEYDWRRRQLSPEDQETRQAGALWGLTLAYAEDPSPVLSRAVERGLAYFDEHSRLVDGVRCTVYPGSDVGHAGTIALVALSHIEYLRAAHALPSASRAQLEARSTEYLSMLLRSQAPDGRWLNDYEPSRCQAGGESSSYSDGEALLALVKAAKYQGRTDLFPTILASAAAGKRLNIDEALARDGDSDVTKGYYQWSSMAFYEIDTSGLAGTRVYGDTVLRLADWVIDRHHILTRNRNTAYAFEGLAHAYALAKSRGDATRAAKYACVIDIGLERLMRWQVDGPLPFRYTVAILRPDALATGGVQNGAFDPALRIDVAQHQLHAAQLARQYVY